MSIPSLIDDIYLLHIYADHISENGILLSFRQSYFEDRSISWHDVAELEERIAAHVDGLELGRDLAQECTLEFLASGDEDELRGAVYALATIAVDDQGLDAVIDAFGKADDAFVPIYVEAFKHGKHPDLLSKLIPHLEHERPVIRAAVVEILGYRRHGDPKRVWPLLHDADPAVKNAAVVACARYGYKEALAPVEQLAYASGALSDEYVLPLLCLGSARALQDCRTDCAKVETASPAKLLALGLAGGAQDLSVLLASQHHPDLSPIVLKAIGIQGHAQAIPRLLDALATTDDAIKLLAAEALDLITAAGLRETVEVAEAEEEVTPNEVLGAASAEKQSDDEPPAPTIRTVERVCTDPVRWSQWWQQRQKDFQAGERFRHGKPFDLGVCIDALAHPNTPYETRQFTYLELVIRSGQPFGFEPDWFIDTQVNAIHVWQNWWSTAKNSFASHPWLSAAR